MLKNISDQKLKQLQHILKKCTCEGKFSKRKELVSKFSFDVKYAAHIVRISDEAEQLLETGEMDVTRSCEMQKAIRRGEMPLEEIEKWFHEKERSLEKLYHETQAVPHRPDVDKIRQLLMECLEMWYGSIDHMAVKTDAEKKLAQIEAILRS